MTALKRSSSEPATPSTSEQPHEESFNEEPTSRLPSVPSTAYGRAALESELDLLDGSHDGLLRASMRMASLVKAGHLDDGHVLAELISESHRDRPEVERAWQSAMAKAKPRRKKPLDRSSDDQFLRIHRWYAAVDAEPLSGSQRKLLTALGHAARDAGRDTFSESQRELSLRAGIGRTTVSRQLRSETVRRFVKCYPSTWWTGKRSRFTLIAQPSQGVVASNGLDLARVMSDSGTVRRSPDNESLRLDPESDIVEMVLPSGHHPELLDPSHDLWGSSGVAFGLYGALSIDQPLSVVEISEIVGCARSTVYSHLARFESRGIASKADQKWTLRPCAEVASDTGIIRARRAQLYATERILFDARREIEAAKDRLVDVIAGGKS